VGSRRSLSSGVLSDHATICPPPGYQRRPHAFDDTAPLVEKKVVKKQHVREESGPSGFEDFRSPPWLARSVILAESVYVVSNSKALTRFRYLSDVPST
jgi:hypothetical protein